MRARRVVAACAAIAALLPALARGAPGDLDPTFDGDGKLTLEIEGFGLRDVAAAPLDTLVVAGTLIPASGPDRFGVLRRLEDGTPDPSFAGGDLATATFTTLEVDATAAALDAGRVVVVGEGREDGGPARFALARFEADGDADPTFGSAGVGRLWTTIDVDGDQPADHATDVAVQEDGRIVVVGSADGDHRAVALRYEVDGDLDPSFSGNGLAIASLGAGPVRAEAVAIDAEGRIVLAGQAGGDLFLARFTASGGFDASFGTAGRVRLDLGASERAIGLAIDDRGRLVVAGRRNTASGKAMLVARLRPGGGLDPNFTGDGWRTVGAADRAGDVAIAADGRIVLGGDDGARFVVVRLVRSGDPDPTFGGGDGVVKSTFACCDAGVAALAPGPAGAVVAGGGGSRAVLARYLGA